MELSYGLTSNSGVCAQWLEVLKLWLKQSSHNGRKFGKLVENLRAEISNLRAQVSSGRPTMPKDLSLISLIPKWSRTEKSVSVTEFFESVESSVTIRNWSQFDKILNTVLKLTEVAKAFYSSNPQLHSTSISCENLRPNVCTDLEM